MKLVSVSKNFGNNTVLKDVNLTLNKGSVIALIGKNGSGKTTLLKIIQGDIMPDNGDIIGDKFVKGFVAQEQVVDAQTVAEGLGIEYEDWQKEVALSSVGLDSTLLNSKISSLSGGEQTRLAFARVMINQPKPSLLLLDEPTNNLDADGLMWLEIFIKSFNGAIVIVSHDRAFINKTATGIALLKNGNINIYGGNYDDYLLANKIEQETAEKEYLEYLEKKKKLEKLISKAKERAKKGVRANRPPDNDKFLWTFKNENVQKSLSGTAKALETKLEKLSEVKKPSDENKYLIKFDAFNHSKKLILRLEDISISFGQRQLFDELNLEVRGNDRVRINGINGSGKSTLLKIAAGILTPEKGRVIYGENITVGYYSQIIDGLNFETSGLENLIEKNISKTDAYSYAASMGLKPADLIKNIKEFSVGQRAKLSFIKLLANNYSLLMLDEPTNHLDIATKEAIESALLQYKGAILFASHDNYFVNKLGITHQIEIGSSRS